MGVFYQMLSPQSAGLFTAAICQSGVPTSVFSKTDKHPAYYSRTLAARLGCDPTTSTRMMVECLRTKDVKELLVASSWRHLAPEGGSYGFGVTRAMLPVIDDFSSRPFIPREPLEMIKSGNYSQVPLVMGKCSPHGMMTVTTTAIVSRLQQG